MKLIENLYEIFLKFRSISTDSRNIKTNDIFFALKGENFDGNKYAETAINNGASYAVIDDEKYKINEKYILVDNVLTALQKLANYHRNKFKGKVIGITGSNGKTTTKELINSILSKKYNTIFTKGNLNNHIGVPITLLSIENETEIAIIEMGANHITDIKDLCDIAEPEIGIITNIGKAHLEGFGGIEGVIKAKTELYKHIENKNGLIFINTDNKILIDNNNVNRKYSYSFYNNSNIKGEIISSEPFLKLRYQFEKNYFDIESNLIGSYNAENILAAIAFGKYFNVSDNDVISAIKNYIPTNNRSQLIIKNSNHIYMDAYNANPSSMEASILNFCNLEAKNKILILGDMLELGEYTNEEHSKIINLVSNKDIGIVYFVGEIFNKQSNENSFIKVEDLINFLKSNKIINSHILIKGSRGIKLEKILDVL